jgi:hypothetical protein
MHRTNVIASTSASRLLSRFSVFSNASSTVNKRFFISDPCAMLVARRSILRSKFGEPTIALTAETAV